MGIPRKLITTVASIPALNAIDAIWHGRAHGPLVTFDGWDGKWWRRIKPGKAAWDAFLWVGPAKVTIPIDIGEEVVRALRSTGSGGSEGG